MKHIKIYENYFDDKKWNEQKAITFRINDKIAVGLFNQERVKSVMDELKPYVDSIKKNKKHHTNLKKVDFNKNQDCLIFDLEGNFKSAGNTKELGSNTYLIIYDDHSTGKAVDGFVFVLDIPHKNSDEFVVLSIPGGTQPYQQSTSELVNIIKQLV